MRDAGAREAPDYDPSSSLTGTLAAAGLLDIAGRAVIAPVPFRQPVAAYVEQFHSTSALARSQPGAGIGCSRRVRDYG